MDTISLRKFSEELIAEIECGEIVIREIRHYSVILVEEAKRVFDYFHRDEDLANVLVSREVLAARYGTLLAIRFRRWIADNYEIGNDDSPFSREDNDRTFLVEHELRADI